MTYCLAMRLDEGLVFLSDTRTNAGLDDVITYRKLHVLRSGPAARPRIRRKPRDDPGGDRPHRGRPRRGRRAREISPRWATLRGGAVRRTSRRRGGRLGSGGTASFIRGGQIGEAAPDILLVYPERNYIRASDDRPFLQIGESKYGKFVLDLAIPADADLVTSTKIAVGSMMSTARANRSVGPPCDAGVYRTGTFALDEYRFTAESARSRRSSASSETCGSRRSSTRSAVSHASL